MKIFSLKPITAGRVLLDIFSKVYGAFTISCELFQNIWRRVDGRFWLTLLLHAFFQLWFWREDFTKIVMLFLASASINAYRIFGKTEAVWMKAYTMMTLVGEGRHYSCHVSLSLSGTTPSGMSATIYSVWCFLVLQGRAVHWNLLVVPKWVVNIGRYYR